MTVFYITANYYDYYYYSLDGYHHGTSILYAGYNSFVSPSLYWEAFGIIDTSSITETINKATFKFNSNAYAIVGKGTTKTYTVGIWTGLIFFPLTNATDKTWSSGLQEIELTPSEIAYINTSGNTVFRIITSNPGSGKSRQMSINAYETSQATAMRLDISFKKKKKTLLRLTDKKRLRKWSK